MFTDPWLGPLPRIKKFKPGYQELWSAALNRPEVTYRRQAAEAIGLAHEGGMPGMPEFSDQLLALLRKPNEHRLVRMAAARTLRLLDVEEAAAPLFNDIQSEDLAMLLIADEALTQWKYKPATEIWLARIGNEAVRPVTRVSAMKSLAIVRFAEAAPVLLKIVTGPSVDGPLRLAAARSLASLKSSGLEESATRLYAAGLDDRLLAATMINMHRGSAARKLMLTMALDNEPTVAGIALRGLLEIDPLLIKHLAPDLIVHPDSNIRHMAAQSLVAQANPQAVSLLGPQLDDTNPTVRRYVRDSLIGLGRQQHLSRAVEDATLAVLRADHWRGLEQAAIVLGRLDHEPASGRLLELLRFSRHEVRVAATAALRWLENPENLPAIFKHTQQVADDWMANARLINSVTGVPVDAVEMINRRPLLEHGYELSQLWQTLGALNYKLAEAFAVQFIPKHCGYREESRAAAVWALGHFRAGEPDNPYAATLADRLNDVNPMDPEKLLVRRTSAITLGRMKARSQSGSLQRWYGSDKSVHVGGSCRWSIMQITGEDLPPLSPLQQWLRRTFLEPLPPPRAPEAAGSIRPL